MAIPVKLMARSIPKKPNKESFLRNIGEKSNIAVRK
jgi:hypothetical protein